MRSTPMNRVARESNIRWRVALGSASYFIGFACVLGLIGPGTEALRSIEVAAAATVSIALIPAGTARLRTVGAVAAIAAFLLLPNDFAQQVAYVAVGVGLSSGNGLGLGRSALAVLGVQVFLEVIPDARGLVERVATSLAVVLPDTPGNALSLTSHGGLLVFAAWLFLALALLPRRPRMFFALGLCVTVIWVLQFKLAAFLAASVGPYWEHGHSTPTFSNLLVLALLLGAVVGASHAIVGIRRAGTEGPRVVPVALATGLVLLGVVTSHGLFGMPLLRERSQRSAAFLNLGGMDWERPGPQEVGVWSGGMFGLLPAYMRAAGWECRAVGPDDLIETLSGHTQLLVIINSPHKWTDAQRKALRRHIGSGGSLLALGDHTDIYGLQEGFNTVLEEFGIEFLFDSAYHDGQSWVGNMFSGFGAPFPSRKVGEASIAIGASLRLTSPAVPWIWGRYGFSDHGKRSNVQGSFLGNYKHEKAERLGDLVVAASAYYGKGQVLAYGDTTGYQNGVLTSSFVSHVGPVLEWLSRASHVHRRFLLVAAAVSMLLIGLGAVLLVRSEGSAATCAIASVVAGLLLGSTTSTVGISAPPMQGLEDPLFLMDYSNAPRVGDYGVKANDPWPLAAAALRTGFLALYMTEWRSDLLERAQCVALVAPQNPLTLSRQAELHALMTRGGCVIVAASGSDARALNEYLSQYEMRIDSSHVGNVPPRHVQDTMRPRLLDASRVLSSHNKTDRYVFGTALAPYILAHQVGKGWLVVAGDSRAFSTRNVEGMWGYWPANTRLLMDILVEFAGGSSTPADELFSSPIQVDAFGKPIKGLGHL